jgi:hypothetical protein
MFERERRGKTNFPPKDAHSAFLMTKKKNQTSATPSQNKKTPTNRHTTTLHIPPHTYAPLFSIQAVISNTQTFFLIKKKEEEVAWLG